MDRPSQIATLLVTRDPEPAEKLRPGLPRDLQAIVDKGMSRNPRRRYASAADLEADLRAFLEYRPVEARPITTTRRLLRRLWRSRALRGAAAVSSLALLAGAAIVVRDWRRDVRATAYASVARHLPPNFTIIDPEARRLIADSDRESIAGLLDRAVERCVDPIPSVVLRAAFRLDHGDARGASHDMRRIAAHTATPYAKRLSERYEALAAEASGSEALDLSGLPEPESTRDRYLHAYHLLRAGDYAGCRSLLEDEEVREIPHARQLSLLLASFGRLSQREQKELALRCYTDAIRMEEQIGYRSARTAHVAGLMLVRQGRYLEARQVLHDALELAPRSAALRVNAGTAAWRLGLHDEAAHHWNTAVDIQPSKFKPYQNLIWLAIDREDFDEADRVLERAPLSDDDSDRAQRLMLQASIDAERALSAREKGDSARCTGLTRRAQETLDAARALANPPEREYGAIIKGLGQDDPDAIFKELAASAASDAERWQRLRSVLAVFPEDLDPDGTARVRELLQAYYEQLASQTEHPSD